MISEVIRELPGSPPITELHVWIGHHASGREGIISADFLTPDGMRHMPLLNSKRVVSEACAPIARKVQSASQHHADRIVRIELRTYRAVSS
jgi:hypothetical protein